MAIVYVLLVAHFVGDFLFQSDWMALNKSKRWDALAAHVGVYTFVLVWAVFVWRATTGAPAPGNSGLAWLVVNAAAHFVTDAITSRITSRLWFLPLYERPQVNVWPTGRNGQSSFGAYTHFTYIRDTRHWFFVAIGADQLIHFITLMATASWWLR